MGEYWTNYIKCLDDSEKEKFTVHNNCETCEFFHVDPQGGFNAGNCYRHPPDVDGDFPKTNGEYGWCGEYRPLGK